MEFKQAMRVIKRICAARDDCEKCELELNCPFVTVPSDHDYVEAEAILTKWAAEHPAKTIMDDFFEKHPMAEKEDDGIPMVCAYRVGYFKECPCRTSEAADCAQCWQRPLAEVEK